MVELIYKILMLVKYKVRKIGYRRLLFKISTIIGFIFCFYVIWIFPLEAAEEFGFAPHQFNLFLFLFICYAIVTLYIILRY
jgi:hypothetical protein